MTIEEAIKQIETTIYFLSNENEGNFTKALKMAINALEKQIPKKPVAGKKHEYWTDYLCPACGYYFEDETMPYCLACGQKLDWSEEENEKNTYEQAKKKMLRK